MRFVGELPGKFLAWAVFDGTLIVICEDHPPLIVCDGKLVELAINPEGKMAIANDSFAAINDPVLRVGASLSLGYMPIGNATESGMILAAVGVDNFGRFWRVENDDTFGSKATLIFDPREYESARDAGPVEAAPREDDAS